MAKYDENDFEIGSDNIFADLKLPDAENLKLKADLAIKIINTIQQLGLNQVEAGKRMNLPQARVSALYNGKFFNMSEQKLMICLNRLGYDIEIIVKPSQNTVGQRTLSVT
ncbi:XRE family transcriptional regulator [Serratia sp. AS12]|uniref:helix-turn-helix domain-containing protein n=1 Tax=Serratia TaxID=613 RepID=UPI00020E96E3|nr:MULTISPECIES: helix-turn-helix transcriptional regulator [Serratia]AEF43993.1 XRE family transcriptional regulator [Serratia plymuthica AS9]AEF48945.1 XRE family transcriptional regulator [Serratia sp. AS12]AEG26653.1 XRE family transcriptional regulator [Serratia sp. AS13]UTN97531.1 helix-turn-helix domain-containing protein [Serratia plymuthica]